MSDSWIARRSAAMGKSFMVPIASRGMIMSEMFLFSSAAVVAKPLRNCSRGCWRVSVALALVAIAFSPSLRGQSGADAGDPRVQQLYSEAKSAEAQGDFAAAAAKYESLLQHAPGLAAAYNNLGSL
jgi:hypothetical protein